MCREIYGWLAPDSVRQTRLLRAQTKRTNPILDPRGALHAADTNSTTGAHAALERRTLLQARTHAAATPRNTSSQGDTEAGRSIAARASSTLVASKDHGFAFSSADQHTSAVVGGIVTSSVSRGSS